LYSHRGYTFVSGGRKEEQEEEQGEEQGEGRERQSEQRGWKGREERKGPKQGNNLSRGFLNVTLLFIEDNEADHEVSIRGMRPVYYYQHQDLHLHVSFFFRSSEVPADSQTFGYKFLRI
jgi:hypothetical protein